MFMSILKHFAAALETIFYGIWHVIAFPFSRRIRVRSMRIQAAIYYPFENHRISLGELLLSEELVVSVGPLKADPHNASEYELLCLASLVKAHKIQRLFEIGTYDGRSSRAMAMNLQPDGLLQTLNLPPGQDKNDADIQNVDSMLNVKVVSGYRFLNTPEAKHIKQLYGDSANFDFSPYAGQMDMVFIDGSHALPYVKTDTESALQLIKKSGGWIVWHDGPLYGVWAFLSGKIKNEKWPIRLIEGTTLVVGYCVAGKIVELPTCREATK